MNMLSQKKLSIESNSRVEFMVIQRKLCSELWKFWLKSNGT